MVVYIACHLHIYILCEQGHSQGGSRQLKIQDDTCWLKIQEPFIKEKNKEQNNLLRKVIYKLNSFLIQFPEESGIFSYL